MGRTRSCETQMPADTTDIRSEICQTASCNFPDIRAPVGRLADTVSLVDRNVAVISESDVKYTSDHFSARTPSLFYKT
jgi:hypothetical protein